MFLFCLVGTLITEYERWRLKTMLEFCTEKHRRRRHQRNMILSDMMEEDRRAERRRQTKRRVSLASISKLVECVMFVLSYELA